MDERSSLLELIRNDALLSKALERAERASEGDTAHDIEHCLRVARMALAIGGDLGVDRREALLAALLHDVVNVPKSSPDRARASALCAEVAREILRAELEPSAVERIARAIEEHSYSRGLVPSTPLGRALQDADRLEALGVVGILRCVSTGARMGADYFDPADPWATGRELDDRAHSVDHFFRKLFTLEATMCTEAGRREARRRRGVMRAFLEALATEIGVPIPDARRAEMS